MRNLTKKRIACFYLNLRMYAQLKHNKKLSRTKMNGLGGGGWAGVGRGGFLRFARMENLPESPKIRPSS